MICDNDSFHDGRAIATGDDDDGDESRRKCLDYKLFIVRKDELGNETK